MRPDGSLNLQIEVSSFEESRCPKRRIWSPFSRISKSTAIIGELQRPHVQLTKGRKKHWLIVTRDIVRLAFLTYLTSSVSSTGIVADRLPCFDSEDFSSSINVSVERS